MLMTPIAGLSAVGNAVRCTASKPWDANLQAQMETIPQVRGWGEGKRVEK